jgi:hypothetical protein
MVVTALNVASHGFYPSEAHRGLEEAHELIRRRINRSIRHGIVISKTAVLGKQFNRSYVLS